jgi:hypothetical protein
MEGDPRRIIRKMKNPSMPSKTALITPTLAGPRFLKARISVSTDVSSFGTYFRSISIATTSHLGWIIFVD